MADFGYDWAGLCTVEAYQYQLLCACGLTLARLERGDGLTGTGGKGIGLKAYVHSSAPFSVLSTVTSQMSIWSTKDDFISVSQISPNKYCCIYTYEVKCTIHSDILSEATKWNIFSPYS